jgi:hypothetical protein
MELQLRSSNMIREEADHLYHRLLVNATQRSQNADASGMVEVDLVSSSYSKASICIMVGYERCVHNRG